MTIRTAQEAKSLLRSGEILMVRSAGKWERLWRYAGGQYMSKTLPADVDQDSSTWTIYPTDRELIANIDNDIKNFGIDLYDS